MQDTLSELDGHTARSGWYLYTLVIIDVFRASEHLDVDLSRIPGRIARCPQRTWKYTHLRSFYTLSRSYCHVMIAFHFIFISASFYAHDHDLICPFVPSPKFPRSQIGIIV